MANYFVCLNKFDMCKTKRTSHLSRFIYLNMLVVYHYFQLFSDEIASRNLIHYGFHEKENAEILGHNKIGATDRMERFHQVPKCIGKPSKTYQSVNNLIKECYDIVYCVEHEVHFQR